jgi:hypothetical protein
MEQSATEYKGLLKIDEANLRNPKSGCSTIEQLAVVGGRPAA